VFKIGAVETAAAFSVRAVRSRNFTPEFSVVVIAWTISAIIGVKSRIGSGMIFE
jgi:hypothetical protein